MKRFKSAGIVLVLLSILSVSYYGVTKLFSISNEISLALSRVESWLPFAFAQ